MCKPRDLLSEQSSTWQTQGCHCYQPALLHNRLQCHHRQNTDCWQSESLPREADSAACICHYHLHAEARQQPELSSETMVHDTAIFLPDPGRLHSANTHSLILVVARQTSWRQLSNYYSCVQIWHGMNEKLAFGRKTQLLTKETAVSDMSKGKKKIKTIYQFSSMVGFGGF